MRTNIVGTNWACVTRCVSISRKTVSASNFLMMIDAAPTRLTAIV
ncbi:hypothetical protein PICSAR240_03284 [Mycobacterium avium subsp. paratuberculosis]|nr:hypothetical protein B0172_01162 [Mycobacterium avium subsp. paratuberculosis]OVF02517.1 hypothetical protein B0173_03506 [Mycobacterium avium subsp. paratuberculosis]CAG6878753.1 hypothetical protein PICSAR10_01523 [Mycobacterium avium subsp. paratuberculosis]CAG6898338.1 hypothetical protein PICSAR119_02542 [Mycobacterium avium subsp. paratuberculosis]CAG6899217.1 hypothetical protein PICSAR118_02614 [Mycobacterium avium subsp. paratuberculosis]